MTDEREIQGKEAGSFGFFDRGRWRVSFKDVCEILPVGTTREQAEFVVNMLPRVYWAGHREADDSARRREAYRRNLEHL
jgi:hypothetical protein